MTLFYISFAGIEGHRGSTVVEADTPIDAIEESHRRGLNPGGEALIAEVPAEQADNPAVRFCLNRLVGKAELLTLGAHVNESTVVAVELGTRH